MCFRRVGLFLVLLACIALSVDPRAQPGAQRTEAGGGEALPVIQINLTGAIGVGTAHMIEEALVRARDQRAGLIVLRLDTPGGLLSPTREIVQAILASPVPVAVFIAPSGARAASAGTYIAYAAHIAAMAPGTHLGAATPVAMGAPGAPPARREDGKPAEGPGSAMERKVLNDSVAYLRSLAQLRGRNADWAEKAVREASTLTAEDAVREKVVDLTAGTVGDLLDRVDGRRVRTADGERTLDTRRARVTVVEPGWKAKLLAIVTDPNVAFILLMIGIYGIIFEFWTPGHLGPGVVGAICLIVGLMAMSVMPVDLAGVALLVAGLAMMVAEAFTPGIGVLGLGGVVAFIVGGMFLFDPAGTDIDLAVGWPILLAAAATNAVMIIGVLGMAIRVRRRRVATGSEQMIGLEGEVIEWHDDRGRVRVRGEIWSARAANPVVPGSRVRVASRDGLTLHVGPPAKES